MINIHLKGSFNCCKAVLAAMQRQRSTAKSSTSVRSPASAATSVRMLRIIPLRRLGIIGLTKSLARYAAPLGINVNAVAPGLVATDLTDEMSPEWKETTISRIPAGRLGRPEEIAWAAAFLASDDASYIFGETLSVNGGSLHGLTPSTLTLLRSLSYEDRCFRRQPLAFSAVCPGLARSWCPSGGYLRHCRICWTEICGSAEV